MKTSSHSLVYQMCSANSRPSYLRGRHMVSTNPSVLILRRSHISLSGSIVNYLEKFPDANRYELLRGIASGMAYLHGEARHLP
jgi:hypothetical protein